MVFILINIFENLSTFLRERYKTLSSIIIPRPKINSQGYEILYGIAHVFCMHVLCIVDTQGRKTSMGYTSYTCIIGKRETNDKMFGMTNSIPGMQSRVKQQVVFYGSSSNMGHHVYFYLYSFQIKYKHGEYDLLALMNGSLPLKPKQFIKKQRPIKSSTKRFLIWRFLVISFDACFRLVSVTITYYSWITK